MFIVSVLPIVNLLVPFFDSRKKKKCKKSKHEEREPEASASGSTSLVEEKDSSGAHDFYSKKTKAEIAFLKRKEKVVSLK